MLRASKIFAAILGLFGILILASGAAEAACQLIKATASADSKANAAKASQALAAQTASPSTDMVIVTTTSACSAIFNC